MSKNDVAMGKKWVKNGKFFRSNMLIINKNVREKIFGPAPPLLPGGERISPQFSPLIYLINGRIRIGLFVHLSLLKKSS